MAWDPEVERHRAWIGYLQPVGLVVSPHALVDAGAVLPENVVEAQQALLAVAPRPDEDADPALTSFSSLALRVLDWPLDQLAGASGGPPLPLLEVALVEHQETLRPTHVLLETDGKVLLPVWEQPRGCDLDRAPEHAEGWHASPEAKLERLLREHKLLCGLLVCPEAVRLVVAPPGESSGYVTFPVPAMCTVAGRPLLAALTLLLGARRLLDVPKEQRLHALVQASRAYQSVVSTKLADQVLGALWELLRGFEGAAEQTPAGRAFAEVARQAPHEVYGGLLTVLLRLVFLLYAEHRGLFPDEPAFRDNYSVTRLFERLRDDHGKNPDTIDQRFGAWAALIALFRLVFYGGGHGKVHLPARHGELFDPAEYPFLEGALVAHDRLERFEVPRVSDGCVLRVLESLLVLDGERLSYRSLDVEQIGSVYEAMMGFSVERAAGRSLAVKPSHAVVDLDALLAVKEGERAKRLKELAGCDLPAAPAAALRSARSVEALVEAIGSRASPRTARVLPVGSLYLQPGEERRRSGSHYTPRLLTSPIVETTLRPVLEQLGARPTPEQLLGLKVCDPAMGSGAFLVETCRQLAGHLVEAWERHKRLPKLPPDEDKLLYAQRLVAQRCLYGVDRNPFAVRLAKLSVWLVTLARDHTFTFVDHALKHGDSLLGLTRDQIARFHWAPTKDDGPLFEEAAAQTKAAATLRQKIGTASDDAAEVTLRLDLKSAEEATHDARLVGDLVALAFFSGENARQRADRRSILHREVRRWRAGEVSVQPLAAEVAERRAGAQPFSPFHWEVEFPEVFERATPGFDAIVGNPPFAGKNTLKSANGDGYIDWLKGLHEESHGAADLVAHFFRRAFNLLRDGGALGLIATNTIAQGDTRGSGLRWICKHGGVIYEARRRFKWPLPGAAVVVSVVHVAKGPTPCRPRLDGQEVERISAFLFPGPNDDDPARLLANEGKSFQGAIVLGMGFTFDDTDKSGEASSLAEMRRLIEKSPRNQERIFPYLGGEELNDSPTQTHHRYVINFEQMDEDIARREWPDLLSIVEVKVKPQRLAQGREVRARYWWRFGEQAPALFAALRGIEAREPPERRRVLAVARVGQHAGFTFLPTGIVPSEQLVLFVETRHAGLAALQSRVHEVWARFFASSLEDRLRYTPADCFETFPFPPDWATNAALEAAGCAYHDHRAALMVANDEGLTKTYNRFHDPALDPSDPKNQGIPRLRELHAAMDRAVLDAYGWSDLPTECVFELEYEIDEEEYRGRKKPYRYRWPAEVREEVLARLLELNRKRAEEERLAGGASGGTVPPLEPPPDGGGPGKAGKDGRQRPAQSGRMGGKAKAPPGPGLFDRKK